MNDKNLRDMWNKAESFMGALGYESTTIEKFISSNSKLASEKIRKMLQFDIGVKLFIIILLILDVIAYYGIQPIITYTCIAAFTLIIPLILFEYRTLQQFSELSDNVKNTNERLTGMLQFLRSQSFVTLLSTSSTYLFGFTAGMLLYFFAEYGQVRRMGGLDFLVFPTICFFGIILNYIQNSNTIKFQIKHLELCLSDLDEDVLPIVSRKIEDQQKKERTTFLLVAIIVFLAFLFLVAVLKELGF